MVGPKPTKACGESGHWRDEGEQTHSYIGAYQGGIIVSPLFPELWRPIIKLGATALGKAEKR
jgi:hypothetical protein